MSTEKYSRTAISLHWLIALGIAMIFGLGWYMTDLPVSPQKIQYYSWHKWGGVSIFLLACIRLIWRVSHPPPALNIPMPAWQKTAAQLMHVGLYVLLFIVPLSGWLYSSARGFQTVYLGYIPLPDLIAKNTELAEILHDVHEILTKGVVALALVHAAAALKHHFIDKDHLLRRMWF